MRPISIRDRSDDNRKIVALKGTYAFEPSSKKFSGNIQVTGNFVNEDSSFEGKISNGKSISFQIIQSDGEKYKVTGSSSAANKMVNGFFDCSIKGFDKGSLVLESSDSEMEDIFLLEGIGATQQLGRVLLEIIGYGDSKGNLYGQWYAEGSHTFAGGTFKGKYQSQKITITGTDVQGNSFTMQSAAKDMTLKVPFEANRGSTCLSSSMAMVLSTTRLEQRSTKSLESSAFRQLSTHQNGFNSKTGLTPLD